jgi:hypothetical protein
MSMQRSWVCRFAAIAAIASTSCAVEVGNDETEEPEGDLSIAAGAFSAPDMGTMFITRAELESKPTSGAGWAFLKASADTSSWGAVNLADQNSLTQSYVLAGALVYARTGITSYRDKVISYIKRVPGTETDGTDQLLNLARTLYGYVVAADLVGMPQSTVCNNGQTWRQFLEGIRTRSIPGNSRWPTLEITSIDTASNWGAYSLSSHLAVSYALNDTAAIQRDINIVKRYLGDSTSPAPVFRPTSAYTTNNNGATWDMSPTMQRGINPASATDGRAGAIVEDILRDGSGSVRCCTPVSSGITYSEEAMDGLFSTMQLLRAHGVDLRDFQNSAAKRAYHYFATHGGPGPYSLSRYLPYFINYLYGTSYATSVEDRPYRHMGYGSWLFSGSPTAPTEPPPPPPPGSTSTITVVGSNANAGGSVTSLTIGRPTAVASGDLMIASVVYRGTAAITPPPGWALARDTTNGGSHMTTFTRLASGSESASYTFSVPTTNGVCGGLTALRGVTAIDASSSASGSGTAATAPGVTTSGSNRALIAVFGQIGAVTYTPPADMAERFDVKTPSGSYYATNAQATAVQANAGGTGARTATASAAGGGWMAQLFAFR